MCCLTYESEQYHKMKQKLPREGQQVTTPMGIAKVVGTNPIKETVLVELESQATVELPLNDVTVEGKSSHGQEENKGEPKTDKATPC
ncbi:MAG: hypothetical protein PHN78_05825, partial [Dehalococcoidales bacterium]|nr:hypothetical protein [Dehalococcoidales bacterium]